MTADPDRVEFASTLTLFVGMLALGVALGAALGLQQLQSACIAVGSLPEPGTSMAAVTLEGNPCWDGAKSLQSTANLSGGAGAVLLLAGGVIDHFDAEIRAALGMEVAA